MADLNGVNPQLAQAVQSLINMSGGKIYVNSGFRTYDQQAALYKQEPNLAAPPGHSNHEKGLAVDLGGDMSLAHQLAARFGLYFPMNWEPWHVELASTRTAAGTSPQAYTQSPNGDPNPMQDQSIAQDPNHVMATGIEAIHSAGLNEGLEAPKLPGQYDNLGLSSGQQQPAAAQASQGGGGSGGGGKTYAGGTGPASGWASTWAKDFLTKGGYPVTPQNIAAINAWARAEGGFNNNNPLNTTGGYGFASHDINSVGVKYFNNYGDSIAANLNALSENHPGYDAIRAALMAGNDPHAVANAVGNSPWGTSGQLMNQILGSS